MTRRLPFWVGTVAWLSIIVHCLILVRSFSVRNSPQFKSILHQVPLPVGLQETLLFLIPTLAVLVSIFMFEGFNWARLSFLLISAIGALYRTWTFHDIPLPAYAVYFLAVFILFQPRSNRFFHQNRRPAWK